MDINNLIDKHKEVLEKYREEKEKEKIIDSILDDSYNLIMVTGSCIIPQHNITINYSGSLMKGQAVYY